LFLFVLCTLCCQILYKVTPLTGSHEMRYCACVTSQCAALIMWRRTWSIIDIPSLIMTFIMSANSSLTFLSTFSFSLKLRAAPIKLDWHGAVSLLLS
jgi:hypothetical protein